MRSLKVHEDFDHGVVLEGRLERLERGRQMHGTVLASIVSIAIREHEAEHHAKP